MSRIKSKIATSWPEHLNPVSIQRCALAISSILLFAVFVQQGIASNGDYVVSPLTRIGAPTYSKQSGLQLCVDSTWAGNRGYRPLRVTASMAKPATADTLITINFGAGNWQNDRRAMSVEHDFVLPQGTSTVTAAFSVPQYLDWDSVGWDVWVDGVKDEYLCSQWGFSFGTSGAVAVGIFAPSPRSIYPTPLLNSVVSSLETHALDLSNLPDQWIDYSPLDVLTTSSQSLELLRVSSPEKLSALLRWVRSGGNLWIQEVGQDFSGLAEIEKLFKSQRNPQSAESTSEANLPSDWHFLKLDGDARKRLYDLVQLTMQESDRKLALSRLEIEDSSDPEIAVDSRKWFVSRSLGLGTIVAFPSDLEARRPSVDAVAIALQRSALTENFHWATRHGNDPAGGNPNFNNLLIPDVGTAPVFEFQLLISLFVIGIGPVNYWLLKRRNQLPLLLVTVPLAALAATLMLFTYGFLADGIGTRVRVRSMTMLDQRAGELASWARLSYYAGIAPSDGLQMPRDTVVYPILPSRSGRRSFSRRHVNQQRSLEWSQQQELTRGWLGSRTPTQYLAITARPTKKLLHFQSQPEQLTVANQLGTQVLTLVVQDRDGNIFLGESLDVEGSATLTPTTYIKAASNVRRLLTENLPQLPAGYVKGNRRRRGDYGISISESLMELHFEAIVSPTASGWGNGTYVAITATGIEVPLGLEGVTESNSFHVVRGTW